MFNSGIGSVDFYRTFDCESDFFDATTVVRRTVVSLTISGGIMVSIILSIIAKSSPSFSNIGATYYVNMYIYMVNAYFLSIFLVGGLVQVSIGLNYVVGNENKKIDFIEGNLEEHGLSGVVGFNKVSLIVKNK